MNEPNQQGTAPESRNAILFAGLLVGALVVFVFWAFVMRQLQYAWEKQADWGHTLFIPFVAGYLVYFNREKLLSTPFRTNWLGLVPVVLGIGWYVTCTIGVPALFHHNLIGAGVGLTCFGIVFLFFGVRATLLLLFPLIYLFLFGQAISDRVLNVVTNRLQEIAAIGSYFLLDIPLDVDRRGNTLFIFYNGVSNPLNIAEACSGMRMLMAFFALGVFLAYTGLSRFWQRALLVTLAIPTALVVNILRIVTLGFLMILDTDFAAGDFHTFIGLVWLVPAYVIYLGLRGLIRQLVIVDPQSGASEKRKSETRKTCYFDSQSRPALLVVCIVLVASRVGFSWAVSSLGIYLSKESVPLRLQLVHIPTRLGDWVATQDDIILGEEAINAMGTRKYLNRFYQKPLENGSVGIMVHIAYYTGLIEAVPHIPDVCFVAGGYTIQENPHNIPLELDRSQWQELSERINLATEKPYWMVERTHHFTREHQQVLMPLGEFLLRTTEFMNPEEIRQRVFAGYLFIANGRTTPMPGNVRELAFNFQDQYAYFCKVQFTMFGNQQLDEDGFIEYVLDLTDEILPELMLCLPDWSVVERRSQADSSQGESSSDQGGVD